jgi:hypothetical protein
MMRFASIAIRSVPLFLYISFTSVAPDCTPGRVTRQFQVKRGVRLLIGEVFIAGAIWTAQTGVITGFEAIDSYERVAAESKMSAISPGFST